jgi:hypothetical protein
MFGAQKASRTTTPSGQINLNWVKHQEILKITTSIISSTSKLFASEDRLLKLLPCAGNHLQCLVPASFKAGFLKRKSFISGVSTALSVSTNTAFVYVTVKHPALKIVLLYLQFFSRSECGLDSRFCTILIYTFTIGD